MAGARNRYGVNDAADCYRTIGGVRYGAWGSFTPVRTMLAYRAANLRVRRFGEETFIHPDDKPKAIEIDKALA